MEEISQSSYQDQPHWQPLQVLLYALLLLALLLLALQLFALPLSSYCCFHCCYTRPRGHLGMRVSVTPSTPKLMHMPHNTAQSIEFTVAAADAAASVLYRRLSCSCAVACRPQVPSIRHQLIPSLVLLLYAQLLLALLLHAPLVSFVRIFICCLQASSCR